MMVVIQRYLPEIKKGGYSILDMSCGSGMFLELSRSFGNKILGTNEPIPCVYAPLLKSQKVPYSLVDGSILPYPFEDNSFDIVTLMNALWFFEEKLWVDIIAELLRISSKTVFIISSLQDKYIDGNKKVAEMVSPPGWVRTIDIGNYIKWEYNGG
jgi:SAM-dependent methyltransferase